MKTILIIFLAALAVASLLAFIFYRLGLVMANVEEELVGMWVNGAGTIRMLIYRADSSLQGDIVWVSGLSEDILGAGILRGITIKGRRGVNGFYIEPDANVQQPVRLRLKGRNVLSLRIYAVDRSKETPEREEHWQRIEQERTGPR